MPVTSASCPFHCAAAYGAGTQVLPHPYVNVSALVLCDVAGGHWEKAKECFNQMIQQGCRPDGITFSALITAYQRGNQWREALQVTQ